MNLDDHHRTGREAASRRNRIDLGIERPRRNGPGIGALASSLRSWWVIWSLMLGTLLALVFASPWSLDDLRVATAGRNCASARAVGLAPAHRGEPDYYWWNDRDGDGIACEPWHRPR
ncbi:excalibur calcium-binding domain-containing protein [Hyphomicrobium sp. DY-1]|jgi:hypothetical protein|uniref:excalibur calcium-binding domain-containing protein n=1 Tax=Hyphomicrobium sp. DY-1 TaxID=3075650 RepID=UPI0039C27232